MKLTASWLSDPGLVRERNEDAALGSELGPGSWVLVVCDGMGGHDAGDVASQTASRRVFQELNARQSDADVPGALVEALHAAHEEVRALAIERGAVMGTTAVVARVIGEDLWFAWVGDSRLAVVRDGAVLTVSVDHTVVQRLIDAGEIAPSDAATHPDAHVLTQAVGGDDEVVPAVTDAPVRLQPGDRVLLYSDGLHDLVATDELPGRVAGLDAEGAARALVELAKARGGHDNVTVAVLAADAEARPLVRESEPDEPSVVTDLRAILPPPPPPPSRKGVPVAAVAGVALAALAVGLLVGWLAGVFR